MRAALVSAWLLFCTPLQVLQKKRIALRLALLSTAAGALGVFLYLHRPQEVSYGGHPLADWLEAYDTNLRFPDDDPPRSGFTEQQIETALDAIAPKALPSLLKWAQGTDSTLKLRANALLEHQHWLRFRFAEYSPHSRLAEAGFMYYGTNTRPLEPALIKMTLDPHSNTRLMGYEVFFFSRPEQKVFLPVACRALKERDPMVQAMAAQWFIQRFPQEAEQAGLRTRFPQFFSHGPGSAEENSQRAHGQGREKRLPISRSGKTENGSKHGQCRSVECAHVCGIDLGNSAQCRASLAAVHLEALAGWKAGQSNLGDRSYGDWTEARLVVDETDGTGPGREG